MDIEVFARVIGGGQARKPCDTEGARTGTK